MCVGRGHSVAIDCVAAIDCAAAIASHLACKHGIKEGDELDAPAKNGRLSSAAENGKQGGGGENAAASQQQSSEILKSALRLVLVTSLSC